MRKKEIGEELGQETSRREKVNEKVWFIISKNAERAGKKLRQDLYQSCKYNLFSTLEYNHCLKQQAKSTKH